MIAIINYGMGNLQSVANSLDALNIENIITSDPEDLRTASGLILPGVGAFGDGMRNLADRGLLEVLNDEVLEKKKPILCICLGLQLIAKEGFEFEQNDGLGWINGIVRKIEPSSPEFKIPHMGWNDVKIRKREGILEGMTEKPVFYFVHSFCLEVEPDSESIITSTCDHGEEFVATIQWENVYAAQFHPEKSQQDGMKLLENFAKIVYDA